ncbi:MAG TPA: efflux RND transporter permease subunit, partial [Candidatus Acidoferrum sp.]|nr:efflux RND transporter permease subunit [Candidatus Acidoferrum sp.]
MIYKLTAAMLRNRPIVVAFLAVFILAGFNAYEHLPVEAYPDVSNLRVQVQTLWAGHAAEEVEQQVTIPLEAALNGVPKRLSMRSISLFGLSQISLIFDDDADPPAARNLVSQLLGTVTLPAGASVSLSPDATPIGEIFRYTLRAPPGFPPEELRAIEDWVVEKKFRSVPGVVDLNPFGGLTKQYQVLVDPARLKAYGLNLQQVFTALQNGNVNAGGGYVEHGAQLYVIRGLGLIHDVDDIKNVAVATVNGTPVLIKDIGQVVIGHATRLGRVGRTDANNGKVITDEDDIPENIVIMRRGDNPTLVCQRVEQMFKEINDNYLPPGVKLVMYYDRTALVDRTVHTVHKNLLEGVCLVMAVTLLFLGLGNWRSALVVALAVPVSLLGAYMLLDLRGIPAN